MFLLKSDRVEVSIGFCLLLAWFWRANGAALLLTVLAAAAVHEAGHCAALALLGGEVHRLRLSVFGAVIETDSRRLTYGREVLALLAGPAANFLGAAAAAGFGTEPARVFLGANLVLCLFNLLPVRPLDGGRVLELLVSRRWGSGAGEWAARIASLCGALLLCLFLCALMRATGGSLWLLPAAAGFGLAVWRESIGK
ncbi:MAG: hypothetical protein E7429_06185 [Ruminococcaceae bacterium]|nr:hypothetical protein [Oscillospiraceae bacterium]